MIRPPHLQALDVRVGAGRQRRVVEAHAVDQDVRRVRTPWTRGPDLAVVEVDLRSVGAADHADVRRGVDVQVRADDVPEGDVVRAREYVPAVHVHVAELEVRRAVDLELAERDGGARGRTQEHVGTGALRRIGGDRILRGIRAGLQLDRLSRSRRMIGAVDRPARGRAQAGAQRERVGCVNLVFRIGEDVPAR